MKKENPEGEGDKLEHKNLYLTDWLINLAGASDKESPVS